MRKFLDSRRGSVTAVATAFFICFAMVLAFAVQTAELYVTRLITQRTADIANEAAGLAPESIVGGVASAQAVATAANLALVNGFSSSQTSTVAVLSGGSYVLATSVTSKPLSALIPFVDATAQSVSTTASAASQVAIGSTLNSDCVAALVGGVQMTGSSAMTGTDCGLAAQTTLTLSGATVSMGWVSVGDDAYHETPLVLDAGALSPDAGSFMFNATTTDTLATNAAVQAAVSHLAALSSWPYTTTIPLTPIAPSVAGNSTTTTVANTTPSTPMANGHYGALAINNATMTFTGSGSADTTCSNPTTFAGTVTLDGGTDAITLNSGCYVFGGDVILDSGTASFIVPSGANVTLVFEKTVTNNTSGGTLSFGAATFSFNGAVVNASGGTITFGAGSKAFAGNITNATGYITFGDGPYYLNEIQVIAQTSTVTFGNGPFYLWNTLLKNGTWGTQVYGSGPYYFYNSAINNQSTNGFGNVSFGGGPYYFSGGALVTSNGGAVVSSGGSTTTFDVGSADFYNGADIVVGGPTYFGYEGSSTTGGATVSLYGGSINVVSAGSLHATGTTIVMSSGGLTASGPILLHAPTGASPSYGITNVALVSTDGDITISGTSNHVTGMIYAPANMVSISGSATIIDNQNTCFGVAAARVTISGSASLSPLPCPDVMPTSSATNVALAR